MGLHLHGEISWHACQHSTGAYQWKESGRQPEKETKSNCFSQLESRLETATRHSPRVVQGPFFSNYPYYILTRSGMDMHICPEVMNIRGCKHIHPIPRIYGSRLLNMLKQPPAFELVTATHCTQNRYFYAQHPSLRKRSASGSFCHQLTECLCRGSRV